MKLKNQLLKNNLPYFWMPKYTDATEPSARTLDVYSSLTTEKKELNEQNE